MNTLDEKVLVEAGQIVSRHEAPRDRAIRLLRELVPAFPNRDKALDHLFYVTATPDLRLLSIAAALHILGDGDPAERLATSELVAALKESQTALVRAAEILRNVGTPLQARHANEAAARAAEVLSRYA